MIRIFIGHDRREPVAFSVLSHSIHARASVPVSIAPLMLSQLGGVFQRERHPKQSTDFSFSRFLVPFLSGFQGWSLFCDCDMLMVDDVARLWALRDERFAVQVVKHHHTPAARVKFLDQPQSPYDRKNWSSVMLFNNARCTALAPEIVATAPGLDLHQFRWLGEDGLIGDLPRRWNHLVDYDAALPVGDLSLIHYTDGGPYFEAYRDCGYAREWREERERMLHAG